MPMSPDKYEEAMRRGNSAAWDQEWQDAVGFYQMALAEAPDDPKALLSLGLAYLEMQDYPEALAAYRKAAQATPDDPIPMEKVAQVSEEVGDIPRAVKAAMQAASLYGKKGDINKAIENWTFVTRINPQELQAHSRLAMTYEKSGRTPQAVTEYLFIAGLLQHDGKQDDASQVLGHAQQLDPGNEQVAQAINLVQKGQPLPLPARPREVMRPPDLSKVPQLETPKDSDTAARKMDPVEETRKAAMAELARALFDLSDEESDSSQEATRGLQELTNGKENGSVRGKQPSMVYHLRQAIDYQTLDQYEEAATEMETVLNLGLETSAVQFNLGWLHVKTGRLESGMRLLQHAVSNQTYALGSRLVVGGVLQEREKHKEAAEEYLEALRIADAAVVPAEQAPALAQMYDPLIEAYLTSASEEDHLKLCNNIKELLVRPDWRTHLANARRELPSHDEEHQLPLAEVLTEAKSGQIVGALTSIHQFARTGNLRVAMDEAYRALDYAPTYLPLHTLMGDLLLRQDRIDTAVAKYTIVARAYSSRGESRRSEEIYRKIVNLAPMDLDSRTRLIDELNSIGDIDSALEEYIALAEVYQRLAEMDEARQIYANALHLAQHSNAGRDWAVRILHNMADLDMQRLDWRKATQIYEQVRQIDPGDQVARANLIDLFLRMGQEQQAMDEIDRYTAYLRQDGKLEDALVVLQELSATHAANPVILERLAQLYQHMGELDTAVKQWDRVGELYLNSGDDAGAIRVLNAIIALNPPDVDEYRRLYQELSESRE